MARLTKKQKLQKQKENALIRKAWKSTGGETVFGTKISYKEFKKRVSIRKEVDNIGTKEAVKRELNTESFVTAAERSRTNLVSAIKENFKEEYKELRNFSRDEKGRFINIKENLTWDSERRGYVLGGKYFIDVTNSPKEVNIYEI